MLTYTQPDTTRITLISMPGILFIILATIITNNDEGTTKFSYYV